jgi:hypothetical protein
VIGAIFVLEGRSESSSFARRLLRFGSSFLIAGVLVAAGRGAESPAELRAVAYLAREVPRWSAEHGCFSCHNNGDGARALLAARAAGYRVPSAALDATLRWLARPSGWDRNKGDPRANDRTLMRVQFASALARAYGPGGMKDRRALEEAALLVAEVQDRGGSWPVDQGSIGSPATYGTVLATAMARRVVAASRGRDLGSSISLADRWLRKARLATVLESAAVLIGLAGSGDGEALERARIAQETIAGSQNPDGGWGPFPRSASEPFDTAVVLVALASRPAPADSIRRGRAYLESIQLEDGSWPETTRPPRGESYAQRISTTAWALEALVTTRKRR